MTADLGDQQRHVLATAQVVFKALATGANPENLYRFVAQVYADPDAGECEVPQANLASKQYVEALSELFAAAVLLLAQAIDAGREEVTR